MLCMLMCVVSIDLRSHLPVRRSYAERQAINSVIQGTAADMAKRAMLAIHQRLRVLHEQHHIPAGRTIARLCLQVHDEIVVEVERVWIDVIAAEMRTAMETAMGEEARVPFPVSVKTGPTLGQLQPYECVDMAAVFAEDDSISPSEASTSTLSTTMTPSPAWSTSPSVYRQG